MQVVDIPNEPLQLVRRSCRSNTRSKHGECGDGNDHPDNGPAGLVTSFQGDSAGFSDIAPITTLLAAAIIAVYIIFGVLYESYVHPITILSTLPSADVGALIALMLFDMDLSIIGLIGIILLVGKVKKHAIMMIDFTADAERRQGLLPAVAIRHAALLRFRPIMMTTM